MANELVKASVASVPATGGKPGLPELVERAGGAARFAWGANKGSGAESTLAGFINQRLLTPYSLPIFAPRIRVAQLSPRKWLSFRPRSTGLGSFFDPPPLF